MDEERELVLLRKFLVQAIKRHPLPWEIAWDTEITAVNGIVLRCGTPEEARDIIYLAEEMCKEKVL